MTDSGDVTDWDDFAEVICVGTSPGVLAYAICCAAHDLDVVMVHPPVGHDPRTVAWVEAMTADLRPASEDPDSEPELFSPTRVVPVPDPDGDRACGRRTVEPFVGEHLRRWSAHCFASPFGVMLTQVSGLLVPARTEAGESITAATVGRLSEGDVFGPDWLRDAARQAGVPEPERAMSAMVLDGGAVAGAELDDGRRVGARYGLAMPVGAPAAGFADPPVIGPGGCTVAILGRPAGRFATVDLIEP